MLQRSCHSSWKDLLARPAPGAHVLQIYDADEFLADAVGHYAAEGLQAGEGVVLTGTRGHLRAIHERLGALGIDAAAAARRGQLAAIDAETALPAVLIDGWPQDDAFQSAVGRMFAASRAAGFERLRWWGEMTSVLASHGQEQASFRLEALGGELAREQGMSVFCSHLTNKFEPRAYRDGPLVELCRLHSHLIPAQDYVQHRLVVNRAIEEVLGPLQGPLLQSLMSWRAGDCDMPSSQAMLLWIRETMPERLPQVLLRALECEGELAG
ncbi:MAG TPA: MEDS domain-containing protein [Burkholderiales bacterium]|nr:MEDS domain-containing protein [Burkholderiales bacterium]